MKRIFSIIGQTYLFWMIFWLSVWFLIERHFSLFSNSFIVSIFPPIGLFYIFSKIKFLFFPLLASIIVTYLVLFRLLAKYKIRLNKIYPFISNALFLILFLIFSEVFLQYEVYKVLEEESPSCVIKKSFLKSFLHSLRSHGKRHTVYVKDGYVYRWSFNENAFYKSETALSVIQCTNEYKQYWENIKKNRMQSIQH